MVENAFSGVGTRHIKTIFRFISEHVEEGFINILFIGTDSNDAETFTKNESRESFEK